MVMFSLYIKIQIKNMTFKNDVLGLRRIKANINNQEICLTDWAYADLLI